MDSWNDIDRLSNVETERQIPVLDDFVHESGTKASSEIFEYVEENDRTGRSASVINVRSLTRRDVSHERLYGTGAQTTGREVYANLFDYDTKYTSDGISKHDGNWSIMGLTQLLHSELSEKSLGDGEGEVLRVGGVSELYRVKVTGNPDEAFNTGEVDGIYVESGTSGGKRNFVHSTGSQKRRIVFQSGIGSRWVFAFASSQANRTMSYGSPDTPDLYTDNGVAGCDIVFQEPLKQKDDTKPHVAISYSRRLPVAGELIQWKPLSDMPSGNRHFRRSRLLGSITYNASNSTFLHTDFQFKKGVTYLAEISGRCSYHGDFEKEYADGNYVRTLADWNNPTPSANAITNTAGLVDELIDFELAFNDGGTYEKFFEAPEDGTIGFKFADSTPEDNTGTITIKFYATIEEATEPLTVSGISNALVVRNAHNSQGTPSDVYEIVSVDSSANSMTIKRHGDTTEATAYMISPSMGRWWRYHALTDSRGTFDQGGKQGSEVMLKVKVRDTNNLDQELEFLMNNLFFEDSTKDAENLDLFYLKSRKGDVEVGYNGSQLYSFPSPVVGLDSLRDEEMVLGGTGTETEVLAGSRTKKRGIRQFEWLMFNMAIPDSQFVSCMGYLRCKYGYPFLDGTVEEMGKSWECNSVLRDRKNQIVEKTTKTVESPWKYCSFETTSTTPTHTDCTTGTKTITWVNTYFTRRKSDTYTVWRRDYSTSTATNGDCYTTQRVFDGTTWVSQCVPSPSGKKVTTARFYTSKEIVFGKHVAFGPFAIPSTTMVGFSFIPCPDDGVNRRAWYKREATLTGDACVSYKKYNKPEYDSTTMESMDSISYRSNERDYTGLVTSTESHSSNGFLISLSHLRAENSVAPSYYKTLTGTTSMSASEATKLTIRTTRKSFSESWLITMPAWNTLTYEGSSEATYRQVGTTDQATSSETYMTVLDTVGDWSIYETFKGAGITENPQLTPSINDYRWNSSGYSMGNNNTPNLAIKWMAKWLSSVTGTSTLYYFHKTHMRRAIIPAQEVTKTRYFDVAVSVPVNSTFTKTTTKSFEATSEVPSTNTTVSSTCGVAHLGCETFYTDKTTNEEDWTSTGISWSNKKDWTYTTTCKTYSPPHEIQNYYGADGIYLSKGEGELKLLGDHHNLFIKKDFFDRIDNLGNGGNLARVGKYLSETLWESYPTYDTNENARITLDRPTEDSTSKNPNLEVVDTNSEQIMTHAALTGSMGELWKRWSTHPDSWNIVMSFVESFIFSSSSETRNYVTHSTYTANNLKGEEQTLSKYFTKNSTLTWDSYDTETMQTHEATYTCGRGMQRLATTVSDWEWRGTPFYTQRKTTMVDRALTCNMNGDTNFLTWITNNTQFDPSYTITTSGSYAVCYDYSECPL
jgi:hypothetical protein